MCFDRVMVIVLDSVGVGPLPDADQYGDTEANTLSHIAQVVGGLPLPHLGRWGVGNLTAIAQTPPTDQPSAYFGRMREASAGKDTMVGHWELAGVITQQPLSYWPDGFSENICAALRRISNRGILGNRVASGTVIIEALGPRHLETGDLILYTSADSVLQIAAHQDVVSVAELHEICRKMRSVADKYRIGRVIARPFTGRKGNFQRTYDRRDFTLKPPSPTVLDAAKNNGIEVVAVGKINDIFAGQGISRFLHTAGNRDGIEKSIALLEHPADGPQLIFVNLVDFDMLYGHRNDPHGYARALIEFDAFVPKIEQAMGERDLVIITADHGNDPTTPGTDHSREYVPLLMYTKTRPKQIRKDRNLGKRETFADVAATICRIFDLPAWPVGTDLLQL
jgi:phosphopentomutase